jgi:hypothetical protein
MSLSTIRNIVQDGRKTVRGWEHYRRQTGRWPWFSIAAHILNWIVMISGMVVLVWCAGEYHIPRAAHRCLPNGGLALWHLVVVDQRQGEAKSDSQWQTSGEVQTSLGKYILVLSLVNGEAALLRRQPTDTDALQ